MSVDFSSPDKKRDICEGAVLEQKSELFSERVLWHSNCVCIVLTPQIHRVSNHIHLHTHTVEVLRHARITTIVLWY